MLNHAQCELDSPGFRLQLLTLFENALRRFEAAVPDQFHRQRETISLLVRRQLHGRLVTLHRGEVIPASFLDVANQVFEIRVVAKRFALFRAGQSVVEATGPELRKSQIELQVSTLRVEIRSPA